MSWLEHQGAEAVWRKVTRHLRDLTNEVKQHTTAEIERLVTPMAEQIDRLNTAVEKELSDDAAQNELIAELKRQLDAAKQAAADAAAGQAGAEATLTEALNAAGAAADRLGSNDPAEQPTEPTDPAPDPGA